MLRRIWRSFVLFAPLSVLRMTFISFTSLPELQRAFGDHLDAIGSAGLFALAPARIADAEDLQVVKGRSEFLTFADLELASFQIRVVKLDHAAAGGADQVIVMGIAADVFVMIVVLAEMDAANQAGADEELERAIDRRARDLDVLLFHLEEELVGLEVIMGGENLANQRGALVGELQPLRGEELLKAIDLSLNDGHGLVETQSQ